MHENLNVFRKTGVVLILDARTEIMRIPKSGDYDMPPPGFEPGSRPFPKRDGLALRDKNDFGSTPYHSSVYERAASLTTRLWGRIN